MQTGHMSPHRASPAWVKRHPWQKETRLNAPSIVVRSPLWLKGRLDKGNLLLAMVAGGCA